MRFLFVLTLINLSNSGCHAADIVKENDGQGSGGYESIQMDPIDSSSNSEGESQKSGSNIQNATLNSSQGTGSKTSSSDEDSSSDTTTSSESSVFVYGDYPRVSIRTKSTSLPVQNSEDGSCLKRLFKSTIGNNLFLTGATVTMVAGASFLGMYLWYTNYPDLNNIKQFFENREDLGAEIFYCYEEHPSYSYPGFESCVGEGAWFNQTKMEYAIPEHANQCLYEDNYIKYPGNLSHWVNHLHSLCSCKVSFLNKMLDNLGSYVKKDSDFNAEEEVGCFVRTNKRGAYEKGTGIQWGCSGDACIEIVKWVPTYAQNAALSNFYSYMRTYAGIAAPIAFSLLGTRLVTTLCGWS